MILSCCFVLSLREPFAYNNHQCRQAEEIHALIHYSDVLGTAGAIFGLGYYIVVSLITSGMSYLHNDSLATMPEWLVLAYKATDTRNGYPSFSAYDAAFSINC